MKDRRAEAIWIEKRGYWQIKVQRDGIRKGFTSSTPGRKGKHEAEAKADDWLEANGTTEIRFPAAWEAFLEYQQQHNSKGTRDWYENIGKYYIVPQIGNRKLSEITPGQLQRAIDAAAAKGLSRVTCKNVRGVIVTLIKFARRQRWECVRLEDGDLTLPKDATPPKQKNVLSSDDIRTLFTDGTVSHYGSRADSWYIHAWRFLVLSGLRRGELCGLRQEDIHDGLISISRSINANGDITRGKNDNARRTFAITRHMQQVLDDQSAMLRQRGIISPWVFPDRYGEAISPYNIYRQWVTYKTQHGIKCTLHELRHTFISLNKSDVPLELIKTVVGHSTSMDTFGIYGHEVYEDQARAAGIIDAVFDRVLPDVGGKVGGE